MDQLSYASEPSQLGSAFVLSKIIQTTGSLAWLTICNKLNPIIFTLNAFIFLFAGLLYFPLHVKMVIFVIPNKFDLLHELSELWTIHSQQTIKSLRHKNSSKTSNAPWRTLVPGGASSLTLVTGDTTTNSGGWSSTSWTFTKMAAVAVFI